MTGDQDEISMFQYFFNASGTQSPDVNRISLGYCTNVVALVECKQPPQCVL